MSELSGFLYNDAGAPVCGACVALFPTACNVGATGGTATTSTTTNSSGFWTRSSVANGQYDVRITNGCTVRFIRYDNEQQVCRLEVRNLVLYDGSCHLDTISASGQAANRTLTVPTVCGNRTFEFIDQAQTVSAVKTHSATHIFQDCVDVVLGTGSDALLRWSDADADNHALVLAVGQSNQVLHIAEKCDVALDWAVSANTADSEVRIHSSCSPATDYITIGRHTGTTADIDVVGGTTLNLQIAGSTEASVTASGLTLPAGSDLLFTGTTGTNDIVLTNGLADALSITDGSADVLVIDTSTSGNVITLTSALTVGSDGSGSDVIFYSGTSGDNLTWDASEELLTITGTDGQTALCVADGNVVIADTLDVNGTIDYDGTCVDFLSSGDIDIVSSNDAAAAIYIAQSTGTSGTVKIHADTGTSVTEGAESINILSDVGGIGLRSTANLANAINLTVDGGTTSSMTLFNDQGTSVTEGAASIALVSDAGGVELRSTADLANAINITNDGGTSGTIMLFNDQGTSVTEGAESISLLSDAGGVGIRSTANLVNAVNITADGGTTSTIQIFNDQGTTASEGAASIQLLSDVGGIGIKSGLNAAGAIRLTADAGTSETIALHADQGNGTGSICLTSDAGGITLNPGTFVTVGANATNAAEIRMFEDTDNGCNYVALKAPNVSTSYTITLPTAVAGGACYVLKSTTGGVTSWAAAAGGGAITRQGGQDTEASMSSTTEADLLTSDTLCIATGAIPVTVKARLRRDATSGGVYFGVKLNSTIVEPARVYFGTSFTNVISFPYEVHFSTFLDTNYDAASQDKIFGFDVMPRDSGGTPDWATINQAVQPNADIYAYTITAKDTNCSTVAAADEMHVYSWAVS